MADLVNVTQRLMKKSYTDTNNAVSEQLVFGVVTRIKDDEDKDKIRIKIADKYEVWEGSSLLISSICRSQELQVGDKVRLLSLNNNKILYAIEKEA